MSAHTAQATGGAHPFGTRTTPTMVGCMIAAFLAILDTQVVATALPRIVGDLHGIDLFAWVTIAYVIASSVTTPIYGKLGDLFGRKVTFLSAMTLFMAGSALSGASGSMEQLIAFRVVQGMGAGGVFVSVLSIIGELFTPREGAKYYGLFGMIFAGASLAGPAVGGILTDVLSWHWIFLVNLPLGAVAFLLLAKYLHLPRQIRTSRLDYAGILTLSGAIVSLTLLTSWAGAQYAWTSPRIIGLGVTAVLCLALFIAAESRAVEPIVPLRLFKDSTFTLSLTGTIICGVVFVGSVNFLALYVQVVTGASPTTSGFVLLPMMLGLVLSSVGSSKSIRKTGKYKIFPVLSMALGIVGALLLSTMDASTPRAVSVLYMVVFGFASGMSAQVFTQAAQNTAPPEGLGAVSGVATFGRSFGTSIGISLFASIFYGRLTDEITAHVPAGALRGVDHNSLSSQSVLDSLAAPVRHAVEQAYAAALTPVFVIAVPILAVGLLVTLCMKNLKLRSQHHGDAGREPASTTGPAPAGASPEAA
ncbi:MDR family MFS transporter [Streptomyces sp. NPDC088337]|uniref:MDR family MFS transporter n=1 Tax=unclassified Streptomyces TaxID=2593676 RepID=UPI002DDA8C9A|nr:MDR family MFS transporter [Streptomyces sp. NBC_01788]WSB30821.1 MFS transporter [Streptomyces sp. NBC_01788]